MVASFTHDSEKIASHPKILALLGLKHSGKSSLGRMLHQDFSWPYNDLDDLVFYAAREDFAELNTFNDTASGLRAFYRLKGKEEFKKYELKAGLSFISSAQTKPFQILSLGGGTMENAELMPTLKTHSILVFLDVSVDLLYQRIIKNGVPPFLDPEKPYESFVKLYEIRRALAKSYAHETLVLGTKDLQETFETISTLVEELRNGWK